MTSEYLLNELLPVPSNSRSVLSHLNHEEINRPLHFGRDQGEQMHTTGIDTGRLLKDVFLNNSQVALSVLSSNSPIDCPRTVRCSTNLAKLLTNGWALHFQWDPNHVGDPGNKRADVMAKSGAESNQSEFPLTLKTACNLIIAAIDNFTSRSLKDFSDNKRWKCLATGDRIPMHLELSHEAVVCFRLTTVHDYLQAHLHGIGLASDGICPLCQIANIDTDHLQNCSELIG
ncbi:putative gag-pol polyprotein [Caerostris darwini]|uniref:Gag-pol polyprotein n=1 Tax=Caerostris darwini TaxID=1538125 RepID=A0AAV4Q983_9ARAC|nr:putative gag-pol polyprotein [Caerostris darwini]